MKTLYRLGVVGILLSFIAACNKDSGKIPNISFKTGSTYTAADKSIAIGDSVLVGINASKAEDKDYLKTFSISKTIGSGSATEIYSEALSGTTGDSYAHDMTIHGTAAQTEKYTFTVVNKDGLTNSVSLTLTVH